ncbi:MAG: hypothetical protein HY702_02940 [Gemmatimonadetes bacterium]|nr:hypothetical protein [Gemmatimonadota bacterium]
MRRSGRVVACALLSLVLACRGDAAPKDVTKREKFLDARKLYAQKLDAAYREDGGSVVAKGRHYEVLELHIPQANALWCETFPSAKNREVLGYLGFKSVVVRDLERQVCLIPLQRP